MKTKLTITEDERDIVISALEANATANKSWAASDKDYYMRAIFNKRHRAFNRAIRILRAAEVGK